MQISAAGMNKTSGSQNFFKHVSADTSCHSFQLLIKTISLGIKATNYNLSKVTYF